MPRHPPCTLSHLTSQPEGVSVNREHCRAVYLRDSMTG
ncbi:hypothetical protein SLIQ_24845 [Serratia liquefaciens FK01]|nr:hypothetical protein SLIQ_24845 [Serratia liquefaciens FK01]